VVLVLTTAGVPVWSRGAPEAPTSGTAPDEQASPTPAPTAAKSKGPIPPPRRDVPGQRFELAPKRELFVPDFFRPDSTTSTQIVVYFHGAAWCSEQCFYDARLNAVLLTVNQTGDTDFASMGAQLPALLIATQTKLADEGITSLPVGPVCITSFSGGYTAVRDILKHPGLVARISDIVLADSLYGPRVPGHDDQLEPEPLQPFLNYARQAAAGGPSFWFSHLYPPEEQYRNNTTTLAASYLIDQIGAERRPASEKNSRGARLLYRTDEGNFHVLGYAGMTTQDHFEHLYSIADLLKKTSLQKAR